MTPLLSADHVTWLQRLSGYEAPRIVEAVDRVDALGVERLSAELGRASGADGYLAATLLWESIDRLTERGVRESRVTARLRRPDIWPMWAESKAAGLIAHFLEADHVLFDEPLESGRNVDFVFCRADVGFLPVEFKALGLSDQERRFCRGWANVMRSLCPPRGLVTFHADIDTDPRRLRREELPDMDRVAAQVADLLPPALRSISGTVMVAHGSQERYIQRMVSTICEHLSQVPEAGGWLALHWGNGAPSNAIREAVQRVDLPEHVFGVMLTGSAIVLDGTTHHFFMLIPRDAESGPWRGFSRTGLNFEPISRGFEFSAGVRPSILRVPINGNLEELLVRDGTESFWPFNLLMDPDPPGVGEGLDRPSPQAQQDEGPTP